MVTPVLLVSSIIFLVLFVIWSTKDWLNMIMKATFIFMSGWTLFTFLVLNGYILKLS